MEYGQVYKSSVQLPAVEWGWIPLQAAGIVLCYRAVYVVGTVRRHQTWKHEWPFSWWMEP